MKIMITEDQKKKLFIPRKIDERKEQYKNQIKKYLDKIKDYDIWDYISTIEYTYNSETGRHNSVLYDKNNQPYYGNFFQRSLYENARELNKMVEEIITFLENNTLLNDDNILFVRSEIINLGDGKLEYKQHNEIRVYNDDVIVVSN